MSFADKVLKENLREILENGVWDKGYEVRPRWSDGSPAYTKKCFALCNRYDLKKEFPIITLRKTNFTNAIDELFWIWQKKSNDTNLLNSKIWDAWADEDGRIGKAYGYQLAQKHKYKEGEFDQVDRVLYDLRHNPTSRRILTNLYNHQDLHEMALYPCAYSMTFNVTEGRLNAILNQRSQDMITANNWNVSQYALLVHLFAQVSNLEVGEFVHMIADAHIYDRHIEMAEYLLEKTPLEAPELEINPSISDFYAFKVEDISLKNYQYHEFPFKIPVAE